MAYGTAGHIGLARETTWGTPVAVSSGDYVYALSENITLQIDRFDTKNIVGNRAEPDDTAGLRHSEGELVVPGYPLGLRHFLRGLTNSGSVTVVLSGLLWRHSYFTPTADASTLAPLPSYTLEVFRDVTSSQRYAGTVFNRGTFSVQPNQDLRLSLGVMAKTTSVVAKGTTTIPTTPTDPFTWDSASLQVGGAAATIVEALTITIDNNLELVPSLNNTNEAAYVRVRGFQGVNVAGTISFDDLTEYNKFVNQTEQAFKLSLFKANSFQIVFDLPRVVYTTFPLGIGGRERLTVDFEGKARYLASSATAIQIDLTTVNSIL